MARRGQPQQPLHAHLTPEQMRAAIPRLKTRIAELRAVNVEGISDRYDPTLSALKQKVVSTLTDILGAGTVEYQQVGSIRLDEASMNIMHATPLHEVREGYSQGIARTIGKLQTLIDLFEEKLGASADDSAARARRAFGDLDLHPEVARSVGRLFEHGHYANAVEDACKILDGLVKLRSGRSDKSGTELMLGVFSPKKPVLKFNDLQTESDKSEQQGMMYLYAGAMLALRNPRAHGLLRDDAESALEYIAFVNLLAKTLDRAQRA